MKAHERLYLIAGAHLVKKWADEAATRGEVFHASGGFMPTGDGVLEARARIEDARLVLTIRVPRATDRAELVAACAHAFFDGPYARRPDVPHPARYHEFVFVGDVVASVLPL